MRIASALAAVAVLAALSLGASGDDAGRGDPAPRSWAFAIGNGMLAGDAGRVAERLDGFDLVAVDGEGARPGEVAALREGATVLAYLSVGTIEGWRSWFPQVKRFRLDAWRDWEDEWFADVSKAGFRKKILRRIAPEILAKGFDGLFLDNVDMIEPGRYRKQRKGMRRLVAGLDRLVGEERLLFAQNGEWGMRRFGIVEHLDGWNREDVTGSFDFDRRTYKRNPRAKVERTLREIERMRDRGLLVTTADYTRRAGNAVARASIENACSVGALPYVSDIKLTAKRLPDPPIVCPGG